MCLNCTRLKSVHDILECSKQLDIEEERIPRKYIQIEQKNQKISRKHEVSYYKLNKCFLFTLKSSENTFKYSNKFILL